MNRSLQQHLSHTLALTIILSCLVAGTTSFILAYLEAREFQDDMLRQIATLSTNGAAASSLSGAQGHNVRDAAISDPESRIIIFQIPRDPIPPWLAHDQQRGFHTLHADNKHLRVFIHDDPSTGRTVVAQPTEIRDEIAIDSALRTLIPLLLLLPVSAWLIVRIVRKELAPIIRLSKMLDEQPADRPQPLTDDALPQEITPFVHAINRLLGRVNHLMGQQRRFIADAAHELRSPLTALSVQAQNLRQAESLEAMRERILPLQEGIERARLLTEQLLNLARTQAGTSEETIVNVSAMARELIADHLPLAESKRIDLGLEEIEPLSLRAAPDALRLIIKNALENALKYTPAGGEVTLRLLSDEDSAIIEVVDNGPGIPALERQRVFDSFYRMPGTHGEGSGLGLAIAREAASRLNGSLSLHEGPDGRGLIVHYRQARET